MHRIFFVGCLHNRLLKKLLQVKVTFYSTRRPIFWLHAELPRLLVPWMTTSGSIEPYCLDVARHSAPTTPGTLLIFDILQLQLQCNIYNQISWTKEDNGESTDGPMSNLLQSQAKRYVLLFFFPSNDSLVCSHLHESCPDKSIWILTTTSAGRC